MSGCRHSLSADILSLKTASYALMHFVLAILVAYALTLDWRKALAIGIVEPIVQTFAFALHDRYWRRREQSDPAASANRSLFAADPVAATPASA